MNSRFQDLMRQATQLTQLGRLKEATDFVKRALGAAKGPGTSDGRPTQDEAQTMRKSMESVLDTPRILVGTECEVIDVTTVAPEPVATESTPATKVDEQPRIIEEPDVPPAPPSPATFTSGLHTHQLQTRHYKLYAPPGAAGRQLPLVVMLHGCTQDPDDFATGTRMNDLAREEGFFVLYPAQSKSANASGCWNWFNKKDQQRGSGEPALLAGMTQAVIDEHGIDARRVYIAGLSAGGAMAAITAAAYPDIFAAAGVHSGLPGGAASNMAEALTAMKRGSKGPAAFAQFSRYRSEWKTAVPTIVFHGDQDSTVNPSNGEQVIAAVLNGAKEGGLQTSSEDVPHVEEGVSGQGMRYTRSTHRNDEGNVLAEHWLLHGAGHAWSGGHGDGTYTDARGPDATREMMRFFKDVSSATESRTQDPKLD